ncbi:DUF6098 family protein [Streptomyces sp. Tue 6430]|nr:DUF6098 family protein [Streptomyces sp. Tue 6430]
MITHRARAALLAASLLLTGCGGGAAAGPGHRDPGLTTTPAAPGTPAPRAARTLPRDLPGLGPKTRAAVPASTRQVVVVTGRGPDSPLSTVALYRRTGTGRLPGLARPQRPARLDRPPPGRRPVARRPYDYAHLPHGKGPGVHPRALTGQEAGRGPDNEPLVADVRPLCRIDPSVIDAARQEMARQEARRGPPRGADR